MGTPRADIILQLKKDILALQGFKPSSNNNELYIGLGMIKHAFPNSTFPREAIHEFICDNTEDVSASAGFIAGLLSSLMHNGGVALWVNSSKSIFSPALKSFGVSPDKVIFVDLQNEKDLVWTIEEALKCTALSAVIGEVSNISFTASRRLQLAVEKSGVTGFILRNNHLNLNTTASIARWKITHLPSFLDDMPGIGFPRWNVELLKVRNGKPGSWQLEWSNGRFRHLPVITSIQTGHQKKAG